MSMDAPLRIPLLRFGRVYDSLESAPIRDHRTGAIVGELVADGVIEKVGGGRGSDHVRSVARVGRRQVDQCLDRNRKLSRPPAQVR